MVTVSCTQCSAELQRTPCRIKRTKRHFCNTECYNEWAATHNMIEVHCAQCNAAIQRRSHLMNQSGIYFCGHLCQQTYQKGNKNPSWRGGKIEFVCEQCKKTFQDYPSNKIGHAAYFCSRTCQGAWQTETRTREQSPSWKGIQTSAECQWCHTTYIRKYRGHRFCSKECKFKWMSATYHGPTSPSWKGVSAPRPCEQCGVMFRPHSGKKGIQPRFCSRACKGIWHSKNIVAERHPNWRGGEIDYYGPNWKSQKKAARNRDGYKCRNCGTKKGQKRKALDVHHITPFREFGYIYGENDHYLQANDLTNLITLCPKCHKKAEHHKIAIQLWLL